MFRLRLPRRLYHVADAVQHPVRAFIKNAMTASFGDHQRANGRTHSPGFLMPAREFGCGTKGSIGLVTTGASRKAPDCGRRISANPAIVRGLLITLWARPAR